MLVCLSLTLMIGLVYVMGRRLTQRTGAVKQELKASFGLVDQNPEGIYYDLRGQVAGVNVVVDVTFQQYARSHGSPTGKRPWTRVRAQLPLSPQVQVRPRHQTVDVETIWPTRPTGDPAFDQQYELFMPDTAALDETLPPPVRDALLTADPPVHVLNDVVLWTRIKIVRDPELLKDAVCSCARLAAAFGTDGTPAAGW